MEKKKHEAILILLVPQVIQLIVMNYKWDEVTAASVFYKSQVYASLEQEDTKLWHLSPMNLFSMFDEEQKNGTFVFPEET